MDLTLLGTGAPEGLPRAGCPCARCATATGDEARAATSVLVDGVFLLDLTPGVTLASARAGQSLDGVTDVLMSHPHLGPSVEIPPGLPEPHRAPDGEELLMGRHRVRALAVDAPGTGYEVADTDGARLLYLPPGAGPAGTGTAPAPYDMVLLDVVSRPDALARLRADGSVGPATDVLAVHLDHQTAPGGELHRRLTALGARALPDGSRLPVGRHTVTGSRWGRAVPRRTLVLGGARSGKSWEAERRLAAFPGVQYVATGGAREGDSEWAGRVARHRERRPASWRTTETRELEPLLTAPADAPLLIDCLGLWLTSAMDECGAWDDNTWNSGGHSALRQRVASLVRAWRKTRRLTVAVSNEVGAGVVPATMSGRRFRDELGRLNAALACESEQVVLMVAGQALPLRQA